MNNLFEKFQSSKSDNGKEKYSPVECLVMVILSGNGKSVKEISKVLGRSVNSLQYKISRRGIGGVKTPQEFCERLKEEYKEESFANWLKEAKEIIENS